jgi:hypothetical protein
MGRGGAFGKENSNLQPGAPWGPNRFGVKCHPDKCYHLAEKELRKIKGLEHVPPEPAPTAAGFAFFCHIALQPYFAVSREMPLNMFVQRC